MYVKHNNGSIVLLVLYVDDLLISSADMGSLNDIKKDLMNRLNIKDLGVASDFLEIRITRNRHKRTLSLDKSTYAEQILSRIGMENAKPVATGYGPS